MTFEDSGIHLPSFIVGLVTSIFGILWIWNHFATEKSNKDESAHAAEVADKSSEDGGAIGSVIEPTTLDKAIAAGNVKELCSILAGMNNWSREKPVAEQIEVKVAEQVEVKVAEQNKVNRGRVDLANELLRHSLTEDQRELAVQSKIDALSSIYGLDLLHGLKGPNVAKTLQAEADKYSKDGNPNISRTARMAKLKHDALELLKQGSRPNVKPVADQIIKLIKEYPDDDLMLSTINLVVKIYNNKAVDQGSQLMRSVESGVRNLDSPKVIEMVQDFSDKARMQSVRYEEKFENRWVNGALGEKELIKISLELLSGPAYGVSVVDSVDRVAMWFEQENQYERAVEIYQQMLKSSELNQNPDGATLARETAEFGMTRAKLVEQKIDFSEASDQGPGFDPASFEQRVVIVVFWSTEDEESMKSLRQVFKDTQSFQLRGCSLLAVSTDRAFSEKFQNVVDSVQGVDFSISDSSGKVNGIWAQCPSKVVPRAMLVDRDGIVVDINVPISEIKTEVGFLLTK